jgi:hypothetical protein
MPLPSEDTTPPVTKNVEGAVEGHVQAARSLDQHPAAGQVDMPRDVQQANHDAVAAQPHAGLDIAAHRLQLGGRTGEITGARANQHVQRDAQAIAGEGDAAEGRGGAAFAEVGAKLHPVGATGLRGQRGFDRIRRDLQQPPRRRHQVLDVA